MRAILCLTVASVITAAAAFPSNGTVETVTVTETSWSTIVSTLSCPAPTTVTVCNAQCTETIAAVTTNNANIVYQTVSDCQAGQVFTIDGQVTTLAQPTTLTVLETISDVVLVPGTAVNVEYDAAATVTNVVYPSSMTASNNQVVTCGSDVTTITDDRTVLSNCPCTVQSTILEVTATASEPMPTALIPSTNYIIQIIYIYVIETVVNEVPTVITRTATSTLTTVSTETETATATATATAIDTVTATTTSTTTPRPTMMTVDQVVYLLEYDTTYNGNAINNLRKRQAGGVAGAPAALEGCLVQCSAQGRCVAASFDENTLSCSPLSQFDLSSRREASGIIFATVIFRPAVSSPSASSSAPISPTASSSSSSRVPTPSRSSSGLISPTASVSSPTVSGSSPTVSGSSPTASASSSAVISVSSSTTPSVFTTPSASTRPSSPTGPGVSTSSIGVITSQTSGSSSRISSSSVPYPISNSSVISTRSSSSSSSSSSVVLPATSSSVTSSTSSSSSSTTTSATTSIFSSSSSVTNSSVTSVTSSSFSSTILPVTNSSSVVTSSSSSTVMPVSNTSVISTTSSSKSSPSVTIVPPITNSSTSIISTSTAPVAPLTECAVVSGLVGYGPAEFYCSSAYPLVASTSLIDTTITNIITTFGPASTMIMNVTVPFETITETVQASTTTTLPIPTEITVTDTVTITETDTVSTTVGVTRRKRQAAPTGPASIFSSVLSRPSSDIEFACSCLQTPTTTSVTVTQTALSTTTITPIISSNLTITPLTTVQTTETNEFTEFSTITATRTLDATTTTTVTETTTVIQLKGTPNPGCDGAVCGNFISCKNGGGCSCYTSAEGPGYCAQDSSCGGPRCSTSADCNGSQICAVNTCCGAQGICLNLTCSNPSRKLIRLARRELAYYRLSRVEYVVLFVLIKYLSEEGAHPDSPSSLYKVANGDNIQVKCNHLTNLSNAGDAVVIYYSGHGGIADYGRDTLATDRDHDDTRPWRYQFIVPMGFDQASERQDFRGIQVYNPHAGITLLSQNIRPKSSP